MPLFQKPPTTPEEVEASKPLDIPAEQVLTFDEGEWYARAFRGDAAQLTLRALAMGGTLGFFLSFTNVYICLKTGWLLGVALTACILSFAISSFLVKIGLAKSPLTILETNCMQSTASAAGYTTVVTLAGPIAAMLMLSVTDTNPRGTHLPWWITALWVITTGALGVMMAIPMKRNLINREKLRFPSGTAAAVMLQGFCSHGAEALAKARALLVSAVFGMVIPLLKDLEILKTVNAEGKVERHAIAPAQSALFDWLGHVKATYWDAKAGMFQEKAFKLSEWNIRLDHSVVLVGAGAIVGLRATMSMLASGLYLCFVMGPAALGSGWTNAMGKFVTAASKPSSAWKEIGIWYGAPLMVAYGLVMFAMQWRTLVRAVAGMKRGSSEVGRDVETARSVEVPMSWFAIGTAIAGAAVVALGATFFSIPVHLGALAVFLAFFFSLVAARATGETDITPGGPLGKLTQLVYGVLIPQSTTANLMTASITAGTSLSCADLLNDLRAGHLLGAHPRRQFMAQFLGIFVGTVGAVAGYFLLVPDATALTGIDGAEPRFAAPGAQQWKVVAELFKYGIGNLHPMARTGIAWGLAWGTALALAESVFPKYRKWIPSATGIGLGLLLPFYTGLAMFLGALAAWVFQRANARQAERFTVPIASGIIAGESIVGVVVAALNNFVFV